MLKQHVFSPFAFSAAEMEHNFCIVLTPIGLRVALGDTHFSTSLSSSLTERSSRCTKLGIEGEG